MLRRLHTSAAAWRRHKQKHYDILQIHQHADKKTIKAQYYRLSKKYHPDLNPQDDEAHRKFLEINEAYSVLGNESSRREYDAELDGVGSAPNRGFRPATGPSVFWRAKAARRRNTGSESAQAQAQHMNQKQGSTFNHREHYERHYQAEEQRRKERLAAAAQRRREKGLETEENKPKLHMSTWSRIWRLGFVLFGIAIVSQEWPLV